MDEDFHNRIKVSELLAKSKGAFIEKREIKANVVQDINITLIADNS